MVANGSSVSISLVAEINRHTCGLADESLVRSSYEPTGELNGQTRQAPRTAGVHAYRAAAMTDPILVEWANRAEAYASKLLREAMAARKKAAAHPNDERLQQCAIDQTQRADRMMQQAIDARNEADRS